MNPHSHLLSIWTGHAMVVFVSMLLGGCLPAYQKTPSDGQWIGLSVFVDGIMEIELSLPPMEKWRVKPSTKFIATEANQLMWLMKTVYDPGWGKYGGVSLTVFDGFVVRMDNGGIDDNNIDFDDISREIYFSRPDYDEMLDVIGPVMINGQKWVQVNLIGNSDSAGVTYFRPIYGKYAILISMSILEGDSFESPLYKERHEDLKKVLQSVQVTVEDFELKRTNEK